jgi:hypothetical protein
LSVYTLSRRALFRGAKIFTSNRCNKTIEPNYHCDHSKYNGNNFPFGNITKIHYPLTEHRHNPTDKEDDVEFFHKVTGIRNK